MIDWSGPAKLFERDDAGSERDYDFHERGIGTVHELVMRVVAMTTDERARIVLDAGPQGTFSVGQLLAMAAREDFPA